MIDAPTALRPRAPGWIDQSEDQRAQLGTLPLAVGEQGLCDPAIRPRHRSANGMALHRVADYSGAPFGMAPGV